MRCRDVTLIGLLTRIITDLEILGGRGGRWLVSMFAQHLCLTFEMPKIKCLPSTRSKITELFQSSPPFQLWQK
jgi:hypothetical protein